MPYDNADQLRAAQAARAASIKRAKKKTGPPRHLSSAGIGPSGYGIPRYVPGAAPKNTPEKKKDKPKDVYEEKKRRNVDTSRAWAMGNLPNPRGGEQRTTPAVTSAAKRRTNTLDERRAERLKHGDFRGKYLGPEAFKGDMKMLKAYRSAGSQADPKKFAKEFKGKYGQQQGWRGVEGKGQGSGDQWRRETKESRNAWKSTHGTEMDRKRRATS